MTSGFECPTGIRTLYIAYKVIFKNFKHFLNVPVEFNAII
jgi:hypothetical protein